VKYFEEIISDSFKRIYQENIDTHGWCVEICDTKVRFGVDTNTYFTVEEIKEMMEWINKNLPKKVYIIHKEYDYNPLDHFTGGDLYFKQEDIKEEYK